MNRQHPDAWILTYSGRRFWPIEPCAEDLDIRDIAHSLSLVNRYTGHSRVAISVAQHSIWVANRTMRKYALEGLLHDASEAYLADVSRPIKHLIPGYVEIEERLERVIAARYGLTYPWPAEVKATDQWAFITEVRDHMNTGGEDVSHWAPGMNPDPVRIDPWRPQEAEEIFLKWYNILWEERHQ